MSTIRLTMAQALVRYLAAQRTERDGVVRPLVAGVFGIFGHGNVAGLGQALSQYRDLLRYVPTRNEQAQVHMATAYARMTNRLSIWACTSSVGPGATNMVTGAATATINRLPVLLLPGDVFAGRGPSPVLQQLEYPGMPDVSVNDCFRPVSRFFDRIMRPEQLLASAPEAVRILTHPAETGAVTLALPEDVQTEAWDWPEAFFTVRTWRVRRPAPDPEALARAAALVRDAQRPLIIAGGGVIYSDAAAALRALVDATGIPVAETQAGKGSLPFDHPLAVGAVGATGTPGANRMAADADVVIGIGTRYSDFTTASMTAFRHPGVRFVNVNVTDADSAKLGGVMVTADARAVLEALSSALAGWNVPADWRARAAAAQQTWDATVQRLHEQRRTPRPAQAEVIGAVNRAAAPRDVVVCAAGSLPGDLHRLWRTRDPKGYHVEYGYSCMGYEVAGGIGVRLAAPDREVFVMVGDGSWLMLSSELVTAVAEGIKVVVVLLNNDGYGSIGALSRSIGSGGFGTAARLRTAAGGLDGPPVPVDFTANAASLGATAVRATTIAELEDALQQARAATGPVVITIDVSPEPSAGSAESWWDVPVAEVSEEPAVRTARERWEAARQRVRRYL